MIIKRSKSFANTDNQLPQQPQQEQPNPKELQIENMKLQRQIMLNNRMREKIQSQQQRAKLQAIANAQRAESKKDEQSMKNQIKIQKMQDENEVNPAERHWNLIKSKSTPTSPVPMK